MQRTDIRNHRIGTLEVILAMSLAGSSVVAGKMLSGRVPVFTTTLLTLSTAFAALIPVLLVSKEALKRIDGREFGLMVLQALFGIVLFRVFLLFGLMRTSSFRAGVILGTAPAVMAVSSRLLLGERIPSGARLAIPLSILGLVALRLPGARMEGVGMAGQPGFWVGDLLVLAAVVSETLLTVFRKKSRARVNAAVNAGMLAGIALILTAPLFLWESRGGNLQALDGRAWFVVSYYGVVCTAIAYTLWGDGSPRIPGWLTGVALAMLPVTSMILSVLVLKERPGVSGIIGACAVIAAVVIAAAGERR